MDRGLAEGPGGELGSCEFILSKQEEQPNIRSSWQQPRLGLSPDCSRRAALPLRLRGGPGARLSRALSVTRQETTRCSELH